MSPDISKNPQFASPLKVNYAGMEKVVEEEEEDESPKTKKAVKRVEMEDFRRELEENRQND